MPDLSLLSSTEVQQSLAAFLRAERRRNRYSRAALAERSTVPASTIKHFELTGQISLRQFLLLWQSLDDLGRLNTLTKAPSAKATPQSIEEVLKQ